MQCSLTTALSGAHNAMCIYQTKLFSDRQHLMQGMRGRGGGWGGVKGVVEVWSPCLPGLQQPMHAYRSRSDLLFWSFCASSLAYVDTNLRKPFIQQNSFGQLAARQLAARQLAARPTSTYSQRMHREILQRSRTTYLQHSWRLREWSADTGC